MVRIIAFIVGIGFCAALLFALGSTLKEMATTTHEPEIQTAHYWHREARPAGLSSDGPFGHFNTAQLQRGLKVYKEVCAACHALHHVRFGQLTALGYTEGQVKTLAAEFQVPSVNPDTGESATRNGAPYDRFPDPYPNAVAAAAANNNAIPPDLSLIVKAREGGADYVYSLLTGYENPPANLPDSLKPSGTLHFNRYFANLNLAMAPPLADGQVTFDDGSPNTKDAMARDVAAFLVWAAEPELARRHAYGWAVIGFLLVLTVLSFMSYRSVWADKKH